MKLRQGSERIEFEKMVGVGRVPSSPAGKEVVYTLLRRRREMKHWRLPSGLGSRSCLSLVLSGGPKKKQIYSSQAVQRIDHTVLVLH